MAKLLLLQIAAAAVTVAPATAAASAPSAIRRIQIPVESELNINTFYNELLRNSGNIPGFELNSVNDDSVIFSFDLMSARGPSARGPGRIDDVD